MPWASHLGYAFTEEGIRKHAPANSGVYGLFAPLVGTVYVGDSENIQEALLELRKKSGSECLRQWHPAGFQFELWPLGERVTRREALTAELQPVCNRPGGERMQLWDVLKARAR